MPIPTPHNNLAQAIFSDPKQASAIFAAVLPAELLRHLDLENAVLQPSRGGQ